jgi:hypothetical protein
LPRPSDRREKSFPTLLSLQSLQGSSPRLATSLPIRPNKSQYAPIVHHRANKPYVSAPSVPPSDPPSVLRGTLVNYKCDGIAYPLRHSINIFITYYIQPTSPPYNPFHSTTYVFHLFLFSCFSSSCFFFFFFVQIALKKRRKNTSV